MEVPAATSDFAEDHTIFKVILQVRPPGAALRGDPGACGASAAAGIHARLHARTCTRTHARAHTHARTRTHTGNRGRCRAWRDPGSGRGRSSPSTGSGSRWSSSSTAHSSTIHSGKFTTDFTGGRSERLRRRCARPVVSSAAALLASASSLSTLAFACICMHACMHMCMCVCVYICYIRLD